MLAVEGTGGHCVKPAALSCYIEVVAVSFIFHSHSPGTTVKQHPSRCCWFPINGRAATRPHLLTPCSLASSMTAVLAELHQQPPHPRLSSTRCDNETKVIGSIERYKEGGHPSKQLSRSLCSNRRRQLDSFLSLSLSRYNTYMLDKPIFTWFLIASLSLL